MLPSLSVAFVVQFLLCSNALSWPKNRRNQLQLSGLEDSGTGTDTDYLKPLLASEGLKQGEIDALFINTNSLESYSRKPDCFRRAASALRIRCGELDMYEDERVKAAISMTLCELATAKHYSPPLECADFSPEYLHVDTPRGSQGRCVEALSRSAQFWSSYSGYLREVPQLCWAFRRWNDIDTAKDIYKNATVEKIAFIRFLTAHEKTADQNMRVWEHHLEKMRDLMAHMRLVSETIEVAADGIASEVVSRLDKAVQSFQTFMEDGYLRSTTRMQFVVDEISKRHALAISNLLPRLEESFASQVNIIFDVLRENNRDTLDLANQIHQKWSDLGSEIFDTQQSIIELAVSVSRATITLDSHTRQAQLAHQQQVESTQAVSILAETITQLTNTAHEEIKKINGTAQLLRESLMTETRDRDWGWWKEGVVYIIEMVWRADPRTFAYLNTLPIFRVGFVLVKCLWYLFRTTFSSLMSVLVVFISSRKYFFKSLASSADPNGIAYRTETTHISESQASPIIHARFFARSSSDTRIHNSYPHSRPTHRTSRIPDRLCISGSR